MATISEAFDDSKSVANSPPSYDTISTTGLSADSINSKRPFTFSYQLTKQNRAAVLSRIRDLVSGQTFTAPLSIDKSVNACASALSAAQFSDLLQTPNIEGHTALYWAIVNHRQEAFSAFASFISKFSSQCSSDLRLACMITSNHALFSQLNLQNTDAKDESLRRFLGCPPDDIEVHEGKELHDRQFTASFRIRMFQKRLRTTEKLNCEFVAGGRIWWLSFEMGSESKWRGHFGLSSSSLPACPKFSFRIDDRRRKGEPACEAPPKALQHMGAGFIETLVPFGYRGKVAGKAITNFTWPLGDWVMYDNPIYVDCDGTLHATVEITLKRS